MAESSSTSGMFANTKCFEAEDIEAGCRAGHNIDTERKTTMIEAWMAGDENFSNEVSDIEKWAGSLATMLEEVPQYMCQPGHPGRITRIPENIRNVDKKAYEPYFLSIGPYHHGKPMVQHMEERKKIVLKCFLEKNPDLSLKDCLKEMKSIEPEARSFYSDIEMESEKFVHMLLLDSFYIVTSLCGAANGEERLNHTGTWTPSGTESEDTEESANPSEVMWTRDDCESTPLVASTNGFDREMNENNSSIQPTWFWTLFMHDIFLIENQLPLFVLQKMHNLAYGGSQTQLISILKDILGEMLLCYTKQDSDTMISSNEEIHHLLHLCHMFFRPSLAYETRASQLTESDEMFRLGSAVQLYEAGVRFMARPASTQHSLLDITFGNSGKMSMPCLYIDDNINSLLRNLIALEQMKYPSMGLDVSAYAVLLLHLVTTPKDVELLRRKGIIQHHLASDKEMVYFINRLSVGLAFDYVEDSYRLKPVFQELKRYTEHRVPRWRAWLKHRYFSNPWTAISLLAASFLLFLTALQTWYSVYSYYHPFFDGRS